MVGARPPVLNLRYSDAKVDDPRQLSLDVYPRDGAGNPVLIFVHGGGWYRGTKSNVDAKPQAFNAHGFVFVSINYRLYPDHSVEEQVGDVAAAIAWVKANIHTYGGDPSRIFMMGHSAGAHLVSLVATDERYLNANGLSLTDLRGVISLDSQAYDLTTLLTNLPQTNGQVYRSVFGDDPKNWKKYSPITYVAPGRGIPPFFLVYTGEKPGRDELTQMFADALVKAGISATVQPAVEQSHGQVNNDFGLPGDPVSNAAFRWLEEILDGL
jgi:acetyl esterase/lipase